MAALALCGLAPPDGAELPEGALPWLLELWPKLGDGGLSEAAYRGG